MNNTLIGTVTGETGFHILLATADVGAVAAVPAGTADKLLCGDNRTSSNARATMRAYRDSSATPITWVTNAGWGATDL